VEGLDAAELGGGTAGFQDGTAHVLGGAVGESDAEGDLRRHAGGNDGGQAIRHDACLAGACGCQYEQGAVKVIEDLSLLGVRIGHRIAGMLMGWGAGDKVKAICFGEGGSGLWNRCEILFGDFPDMLKNQTPAGSRGPGGPGLVFSITPPAAHPPPSFPAARPCTRYRSTQELPVFPTATGAFHDAPLPGHVKQRG
jgi:hypothetical protein